MYSMVTSVVVHDGMFSGRENTLAGWLLAATITVRISFPREFLPILTNFTNVDQCWPILTNFMLFNVDLLTQVVGMSFLYRDYGSASSFLQAFVLSFNILTLSVIPWFDTFLWIHQDGYYYHCWLDYETGLMWAQIVPMFVLVFLVTIFPISISKTVVRHLGKILKYLLKSYLNWWSWCRWL